MPKLALPPETETANRKNFGLSVMCAGVQSFSVWCFRLRWGSLFWRDFRTCKLLLGFWFLYILHIFQFLQLLKIYRYIFIYIFFIFQPSGRQVTKKSASSEVRPKLALPPETETANRKNFGLLQTVGRVHRLRGEKPKTTNLWDLTEILYNAPKINQKR